MIKIGIDENQNPIYKEAKKIIIMFLDENNIVSFHKRKPFFTGHVWMVKLKKQSIAIDTEVIYFNKQLIFYVIMKEPKHVKGNQ